MPKVEQVNLDDGTSRIWNGEDFSGTAVVYAVTPDDHTAFQCDFLLETLIETYPREVRACRQAQKGKGENVLPIRRDQLRHEVILIFGPEMSATNAVDALQRLARHIEKHGLLIGRDEPGGDFLVETTSPRPRLVR